MAQLSLFERIPMPLLGSSTGVGASGSPRVGIRWTRELVDVGGGWDRTVVVFGCGCRFVAETRVTVGGGVSQRHPSGLAVDVCFAHESAPE